MCIQMRPAFLKTFSAWKAHPRSMWRVSKPSKVCRENDSEWSGFQKDLKAKHSHQTWRPVMDHSEANMMMNHFFMDTTGLREPMMKKPWWISQQQNWDPIMISEKRRHLAWWAHQIYVSNCMAGHAGGYVAQSSMPKTWFWIAKIWPNIKTSWQVHVTCQRKHLAHCQGINGSDMLVKSAEDIIATIEDCEGRTLNGENRILQLFILRSNDQVMNLSARWPVSYTHLTLPTILLV